MKGALASLPAVIVLVSTAVLCADVPAVSWDDDIELLRPARFRESASQHRNSPRPAQPFRRSAGHRSPLYRSSRIAVSRRVADVSYQPQTDQRTIILSSGHGSMSLFLAAFASLGAWQFVRSVRHAEFRLGHIPEWYHADGQTQIGHATAIRPDLTAAATISICDFPTVQSIRFLLRRTVSLRLKSQFTPVLATPRAPPCLCL